MKLLVNYATNSVRVGTRHRKDMGRLDELAASMARIGRLYHPITVSPDGQLILGARRLAAAKSLNWPTIQAIVAEDINDVVERALAERDENTCRKDFAPTERVSLGSTINALMRKAAKERQKTHGNTAPGRAKNTPGKLPEVITGDTRDKIGAAVGLSGRTYEKAKAVVDAAEKEPKKYGKYAEEMDRTGKINGAYKRLKIAQEAEKIEAEPAPMPTGPFHVIVIDPPWQYASRGNDPSHRAANPYPSMTLEEIAALDIGALAHPNSILWLWTTNAHLPHVFGLLEGWGFQYKTMLTWIKDRFGTGDWLRGQTEHCLLATRGKPTVTLKNQTTALEATAGRHSEKPQAFYDLVESLCPGSKLEMFARTQRKGWQFHGSDMH
jgi:N6-adenosine-specific RNA methylase IME4/ParB-like chromosome segregation protein Spo0J